MKKITLKLDPLSSLLYAYRRISVTTELYAYDFVKHSSRMSLAEIFQKILINTHCKKLAQMIFKSKYLKSGTSDKSKLECWSKNWLMISLTLFRWAFLGLLTDGGDEKDPTCLKYVTHILQWWNLAQVYLT